MLGAWSFLSFVPALRRVTVVSHALRRPSASRLVTGLAAGGLLVNETGWATNVVTGAAAAAATGVALGRAVACALLLCPAFSGLSFGRLQAAAGPYYAPIRRQIDGFALGVTRAGAGVWGRRGSSPWAVILQKFSCKAVITGVRWPVITGGNYR